MNKGKKIISVEQHKKILRMLRDNISSATVIFSHLSTRCDEHGDNCAELQKNIDNAIRFNAGLTCAMNKIDELL